MHKDPVASVPDPEMPTIAMVGRTNVGKSTLFNRLTGGKRALVAASPGLTRDRREGFVRRGGYRFRIVDTGGMEYDDETPFGSEIAAQVREAVGQADGVWLVVDVVSGLNPLDERIFRWLDQEGVPIWLVGNKADHGDRDSETAEFFGLGVDAVYPTSAIHGRGLDSLMEATAERIPALTSAPGTSSAVIPAAIRVGLVGKPNVGKSSLVNSMLGAGRMIVSEVAGTTREPVDIPLTVNGEQFVLIDTAGIRRRARTKEALEKIGALTSLGALERVDIAILVVDAGESISDQDAKIAGQILQRRRGVVVAINKWDKVAPTQQREVLADIRHRLRFLDFAPQVQVSALKGQGVEELFRTIRQVQAQFTRQIQTADLNRIIKPTVLNRPPPSGSRSATRIHYGTQVSSRPPTFWLFSNHPDRLTPAYSRYFANQLRYHFGFEGTPLVIQWKGRDEPARSPPPTRGSGMRN